MDVWAILKFYLGIDDGINKYLTSQIIYEAIEASDSSKSTVAIYEFLYKGRDHYEGASVWIAEDIASMKVDNSLSNVIENSHELDLHTMDMVVDYLDNNGAQDFMSIWLAGTDLISHAGGPKETYGSGSMANVDAQIGRLITKLKQLGVYDETVIVITADHGQTLVTDNNNASITRNELSAPLLNAGYYSLYLTDDFEKNKSREMRGKKKRR